MALNVDNDDANGKLLQDLLTRYQSGSPLIEFKQNVDKLKIGKAISAMANTAALLQAEHGYVIFGVDGDSYKVIGTSFNPFKFKVPGSGLLESWLREAGLSAGASFRFKPFIDSRSKLTVVILEIDQAETFPLEFDHVRYIRIGTSSRELAKYPAVERKLWSALLAKSDLLDLPIMRVEPLQIAQLLDLNAYYHLLWRKAVPTAQQCWLHDLAKDGLVEQSLNGCFITSLGAILLANDLDNFPALRHKKFRVISHVSGIRKEENFAEFTLNKGYAAGATELLAYIQAQLPAGEQVANFGPCSRWVMVPARSLREIVINAMIHQDFSIHSAPRVEIMHDRVEVYSHGRPGMRPWRFIDCCEYKRNPALVDLMAKLTFCTGRGFGIDKVIQEAEKVHAVAPNFEELPDNTLKVTLYGPKSLQQQSKGERLRACYQHCCLNYVNGVPTTNATLRKRLGADDSKISIVSHIITDALAEKYIKVQGDSAGKRKRCYVPIWAPDSVQVTRGAVPQ